MSIPENKKGAVSLGELRQILKAFAKILASGGSHRACNGLIFGKSVTFMHFDAHKNFQLCLITLSLSNDHFIICDDNHHFDEDRVI